MVAGEIVKVTEVEDLPEPVLEELRSKAIEPVVLEKTDKRMAIIAEDPKCSYICGSAGTEEDLKKIREKVELISSQKIDYAVVTEAQKEHHEDVIDKRNSLSFMSVNSVDEGVEWYRQNFPKIPEELYPIMARWNFGDLSQVTKKDVKNDKKRVKQGKKPKVCQGLEVKKGPFVVEF